MRPKLPSKSRFVTTIIFVFFFLNLSAQTLPPYQWVKTAGSTGSDRVTRLKADGAGNLYSTGLFTTSITLGSFTLTPPSSANGNFVAKQDANGNYLWAMALPRFSASSTPLWLTVLAVDAAGNVYTAGRFTGSLTFGSTTLTSPGTAIDYSVYVTKQDTDGNYLWAVMISDPGAAGTVATLNSIFADAAGNVYLTGRFSGTLDFDPGAATANLAGVTLQNVFIAKLDNGGNYSWAKALTSTTGTSSDGYGASGEDITVDASGNVYSTGYITSTAGNQYVDFDPGPDVYPLTTNAGGNTIHYINKLNANGDHIWSGVYGNGIGGATLSVTYIAVDMNNDVYATGWFTGTADFDPGAGTASMTAADDDGFLLKLDNAGNYLWAKQLAGTGICFIRAFDFDGSGNVYLTGTITGTADLDPGAGVVNITVPSTTSYFAKWDDQGDYIDAQAIMNTASDGTSPYGLVVNSSGTSVYVAGQFSGTMDFDPGAGSALVTSAGVGDVFLLNLAPTTLPIILSYFNALPKGTTSELSWMTGSESNNKGFNILRSSDGSSWQSIGFVSSQAAGGNSANDLTYHFTDKAPQSGTNYYRLKQEDFDGRTDFSRISSVTFNSSNGIRVYPNPTNGILYLSGMSGGESVWIYNATGQLLRSQKVNNGGIYNLSLRGLTKGLYHIKVGARVETFKTFKITVD